MSIPQCAWRRTLTQRHDYYTVVLQTRSSAGLEAFVHRNRRKHEIEVELFNLGNIRAMLLSFRNLSSAVEISEAERDRKSFWMFCDLTFAVEASDQRTSFRADNILENLN